MIFITGPHSAGKTTIAKKLRDHGFLHVETGDIVRRKHQEIAPDVEFGRWVSEQQHKFDHYILEIVLDTQRQIEQSYGLLQNIVITGNRQIDGVVYLMENVPPLNKKPNLIIYVEADEQILFKRYIRRPDRTDASLTFEKFKEEILGFDKKMGLENIKRRANFIVQNEREIDYCVGCIRRFLKSYGYRFQGEMIEGYTRNCEIK